MATAHGKLVTVLGNEFDLSNRVSQVSAGRTQQAVNITGMGVDDEEYLAGMQAANLTLQGVWDDAAGGPQPVYTAELGTTTNFTVVWNGGDASGDQGNACFLIQTLTDQYSPRLTNQDAVRYTAGGPAAEAARFSGILLHPLVAETGAASTASHDNSSSSTFGGQAHLHVTAFTGTSAAIKVEDSANDSLWADLITFTSVTGVTSERLTVAGTVDRYTRVDISGTFTSVTFAVGFARNYQ